MSWKLHTLLAQERFETVRGGNPEVLGLVYDSREVQPGDLFFALPGIHTDGTRFVADAHRRGAVAAVVQTVPAQLPEGLAVVQVPDVRWTMSALSDRFHGHPSHELCVIGVTGTDGKSSTVGFIAQLLGSVGLPVGFFSTVEYRDGSQAGPNVFRQSTPEAPQIHGLLRRMVDNGLRFAVLESTSHGLSLRTARLAHVCYTGAVFTNVTVEHLEFHGTVEQYRRDKARLFEALDAGPPEAFGVVNLDDPHHGLFQGATRRPVLTYSLRDMGADLWAADLRESQDGISFRLMPLDLPVRLPHTGAYNVSNALAALLAATQASGRSLQDFLPALETLRAPKGRMRRVDRGQPFLAIVDYAHTPGSFEAVLPALRAMACGRLIVVFGSAGERDRTKRPLQGELADRHADLVVLTDEDPRLEDPERILDDIQAGIRHKVLGRDLFRVRPRRQAIRFAVEQARPGDVVAFLGKGHESSILGPTREDWDEEAEVGAALEALGYAAG